MEQTVLRLLRQQFALAEQMAKALTVFNLQRSKQAELLEQMMERDTNARAKELMQWESLMQSFRCLYEQIFMSHVDTWDTSAEEGIAHLGSGEDDEDSDTKAVESGPTTQEADAQALGGPPGLVTHRGRVPPHVFWGQLREEQRQALRAAGKSRRQRDRRERRQQKKQHDKATTAV